MPHESNDSGTLRRSDESSSVSLRAIRQFARRVAERFLPDKIVLFGSYAYGTPREDSDVDILVIMPTLNQIDQAIKIGCEIPAPFQMDLIVRTPKNLGWRLAEGESFHTEIMTRGKVLYEKSDSRVGPQRRGRSSRRRTTRQRESPVA